MSSRVAMRLFVAALLVFASCGEASGGGVDPPPREDVCREGSVEGCHMVAVTFDAPTSLDAVRMLTASWPGIVHGVWRQDWVCLETPGVLMAEPKAASRFAYLGAESIPGRVVESAPPVTDGGSSQSVWEQRIEALQRVKEDDASLVAVAAWVPIDFEVAGPGIESSRVVPHRYAYEEAKVLYVGAPGFSADPVLDVEFAWTTQAPTCE